MLLPRLSVAVVAVGLGAAPTPAQEPVPNTEFQITAIETALQESPQFETGVYDKRARKPGRWLEVETTFDWQPRAAEPKYLDDVTVTYYVLLNNKSREFPAGTLLVGSVTHTSVSQGKDLKSVMYVPPKTLERFFDGKAPVNDSQAVAGVGAEIAVRGQVVAGYTTSGRGPDRARPWAWWDDPSFKDKTTGVLLNKSETPFAPLAYDYYEVIKMMPASP